MPSPRSAEPLTHFETRKHEALRYGQNTGRAAIIAGGQLLLWTLCPRVELESTLPLDGTAHNANFLDPDATLIAVSGFSGDITVVATHDGRVFQRRSALPAGESGTVVQPVPSTHGNGATVVTRAPSGVTNVWLVDANEQTQALDPALGTITKVASASDHSGGWIVVTDGTPSVGLWRLPGPSGHQSSAAVLTHSEDIEAVAVTATAGRATAAVLGDTKATLWTIQGDAGQADAALTWTVESGLADYLAVANLGATTVVAAAGLEGIQVWLAPSGRTQPVPVAGASIPITTLTVLDERDEFVTVAAADEDDKLHLITARLDGHINIHSVPAGHEVVTRCLSLPSTAQGPCLATTSFTGEIRVWDVKGDEITVRHRMQLPEDPNLAVSLESSGRAMLAFTAPAGIILWDIPGGPDSATLVRTSGRRPSHLVVVGAAQERRIVCAYTSGSVAVIDPATNAVSELELNCAFTHLTGMTNPNWVIGTHGAALVALRPYPSRASGR